MKRTLIYTLIALMLLALCAGCGNAGVIPTPTPHITPTPSAMPKLDATPRVTTTPRVTPSPTPEHTQLS